MKRVVLLGETDCFHMMFFSRLHQWGIEILNTLTKEALDSSAINRSWFFLETQAQYHQPFLLDDMIDITIYLQRINLYSFSLAYSFQKENFLRKNTLFFSVAVMDQNQEKFIPLSFQLQDSLIKI